VAVDACGVTTFALPLRRIAALYARLPTSDPLQFAAMRARPELVAGPGRLDTRLMRTLPGCVAKLGSEALEGIALSEPGIGIAVRIEDGDPTLRALGAATLAILAQLVDTDLSGLDDIAQPMLRVLGRETVAASVRAELELRFC
jgi:L-asparaginase II